MMKWLVGVLLLLNLLVLAWGVTRPSPGLREIERGGATLVLLAEARPALAPLPSVPRQSPVAAKSQPPRLARVERPRVTTDKGRRPRVFSVGRNRAVIPQESQGLLFSDTPCRTLGPFPERSAAQRVARQLAELHIAATLRDVTGADVAGYWVLMPPREDPVQAREMLAKLSAAGFDDAWLFKEGDMANAISLGLYSREDNARRRAEQVRDAGFDAWVKPQQQEFVLYWLDYRLDDHGRLPGRVRRLVRGEASGVREFPRRCVGARQ